ncbi:protein serine/threonine phosphatase [Aureococcus anophagefferens]|nr:protein serine/threonine phosphatase [Aureococcus anophagefferens]
MLQKAAETTPGFRLVGDAAISADDLGWSCALIDGVLEFETPTLDECAWLSQRLAECGAVDAVELFASTALGYWGEFREAATPYADDHWDFDGHDLRTDRVHWVDGSAAPAFAGAVGALKSVAAYLNGHFVDGPGFLCRGPAPPAAPATADAPLTVTRHVQLATYRPEVDGSGGYTLHSDNGPSSPGKAKKNGRHVTAILYLNEHWDEADGGALELYPDSVDDAAVQRVLLGQAGRAWTPADERNLEAALAGHRRVEVWPEAGTVVVFDSRLVHTVRPAKRDRRALTL